MDTFDPPLLPGGALHLGIDRYLYLCLCLSLVSSLLDSVVSGRGLNVIPPPFRVQDGARHPEVHVQGPRLLEREGHHSVRRRQHQGKTRKDNVDRGSPIWCTDFEEKGGILRCDSMGWVVASSARLMQTREEVMIRCNSMNRGSRVCRTNGVKKRRRADKMRQHEQG